MAITQGINGTFVQYVEVDNEEIYLRKFKKTVPVDNVWEDRVFYEITKFPMGRQSTLEWLDKHYGKPKYSENWWNTYNGICMNEKIYIHYKLME